MFEIIFHAEAGIVFKFSAKMSLVFLQKISVFDCCQSCTLRCRKELANEGTTTEAIKVTHWVVLA